MEGKKCPSCESDAIEYDDASAVAQFVCTSCGTIIEECFALSTLGAAGMSYAPNDGTSSLQTNLNRFKKYSHCNIPPGKRQCLEKISQLASVFSLSPDMKEYAKKLFCDAYQALFRNDRMPRKYILAACCVFVVLRRYNRPVIYEDICRYLDCNAKQFFAVYKLFEQFSGIKVSKQTIDEFVPIVLRDMVVDDKAKLIKKTIEIVNIYYKCSLLSGRSRKHIVLAAAYVAWASSDYSRVRVKFSKFFSMFSFPKGDFHTAALRVNDVLSLFIKHAEKLPFLEGSLDKKRIFIYVDDVLKHFVSLHSSVTPEGNSSDCDSGTLENEKCVAKENIPYPDPSSTTDFCDEYISDTEIDGYIRTEAEVVKFRELRSLILGKPVENED